MRLNVLIGCIAIITMLSGCLTPQERADARKTAYREKAAARKTAWEFEQREIKRRENSYKATCATYGYEVETPQFNQCVTTEKRQYEAEQRDAQAAQRDAQAAEEREALATKMARQANEDEWRRYEEHIGFKRYGW